MRNLILLSAALLPALRVAAQDDVLARIREEGFQRSQVMELAFHMTDVLGPRVTSSRGEKKAQDWAQSLSGTGRGIGSLSVAAKE